MVLEVLSSYSIQLEWIHALQKLRTPALDQFFKFLDFFDRQEFFLILIPAIWMGYHWKTGLRLFYIIMLSGLVNYALKYLFHHPRPFHLDPAVGIIQVSGNGLPSGAAQSAVLLAGILLNYCKNIWAWIVAILYVFFTSLARVYLGVHFPTDILGGWAVGLGLWALFTYVRPSLERWLATFRRTTLFWISQAIPLLLLCFSREFPVIRLVLPALAIGLGVFLSSRYHLFLGFPQNRQECIARGIYGIASTFLVYGGVFLAPIAPKWLSFLILFYSLGLWLSVGAPVLWRFLARKAKN